MATRRESHTQWDIRREARRHEGRDQVSSIWNWEWHRADTEQAQEATWDPPEDIVPSGK